jgi:hypothetical protein
MVKKLKVGFLVDGEGDQVVKEINLDRYTIP